MKMEMPQHVSIVVPVYNAERYVAETLDSLLAQTYPRLEIIAVNDGSTDRSGEILSTYKDRLRVLDQENRGQSASLNRGWQEAAGDVLGYLSADDVLAPTAVQDVVAALLASPRRVMAYPDYWLIDSRGNRLRQVRAPGFDFTAAVLDGECATGPGALFRRSVLDKAGGWDTRLRQIPDWEFLLRAGLCGEIARLPKPLAFFRVHEGSQTFALPNAGRTPEYEIALDTFFARPDIPREVARQQSRAYANAMVLTARIHLLSGAPGSALTCLRRAFVYWPRWPARYRNFKLLMNGLLGRPRMRFRSAARAWLWRIRQPSS